MHKFAYLEHRYIMSKLRTVYLLSFVMALSGSLQLNCFARPLELEPCTQSDNVHRHHLGHTLASQDAVAISASSSQSNLPGSIKENLANYVVDERAERQLLEKLKLEAENSIKDNMANYVSDDTDLEQILSLINSDLLSQESDRPRRNVLDLNREDDANECPICLEEISSRDKYALRHCRHEMHYECMRQWAERCGNQICCPICRRINNL